jgi:hypothetical protein
MTDQNAEGRAMGTPIAVRARDDDESGWLEIRFNTGRAIRFDRLRITVEGIELIRRTAMTGKPITADDLLAIVKPMTA